MNAVQLARTQADGAYRSLLEALDGVSEGQAWAVLPNLGPDYLHTDASIQGTTLHIADKFIYGSCAFCRTGRWRTWLPRRWTNSGQLTAAASRRRSRILDNLAEHRRDFIRRNTAVLQQV
ncbi:MAG: hypothetical protein U0S12_06385 [Fimbriimonadales bacterium]